MSGPVRVIGGWLDGRDLRHPWGAEGAALSGYRCRQIDGKWVATPLRWPEGREAEGIAMVRLFGPDENDWPAAFVDDFLLRKDKNSS